MTNRKQGAMTYSDAGVDQAREDVSMKKLSGWVRKTFGLNSGARVLMDLGFFANVIDVGLAECIAVATDGIGTKILIAQMMRRYDTLALDCMAMNVNDIICVGARPFCFLDYLAISQPDETVIDEIGKGLHQAAALAQVSIPGGELAQVGDLLSKGADGLGLDLTGSAVGTVPKDKIISGRDIQEGDAVIAIASNGLHSNGYTLARKTLLERGGLSLDRTHPDLGETLGEALLRPTPIYTGPVLEILNSGVRVRGLANITGGGLLNLNRFHSDTGFILDALPEPPPLFRLLKEIGKIEDAEMHSAFNMGVGFCIIVPSDSDEEGRVIDILEKHGFAGRRIGSALRDPEKTIRLPGRSLASSGDCFVRV